MKRLWALLKGLFSWSKPTESSPPTASTPIPHQPPIAPDHPTGGNAPCRESSAPPTPVPSKDDPSTGNSISGTIENHTNKTSPKTDDIKDNTRTKPGTKGTTTPDTPNGRDSGKEPPNIDGRRGQKSGTDIRHNTKPTYVEKPELICRGNQRGFDIILSIPSNYNINSVQQDGTLLELDGSEYRITDYSTPLTITNNDGKAQTFSLASENGYMIFKTRINWEGQGRLIQYLTQGFFLVIAPNHWHRRGNPPVEPTPCSDERYLAHFFKIDADDTDIEPENNNFFDECLNLPLRQKILLEGKMVSDNSNQGNLFVQEPPKLKILPGVVWVRVGVEGRNRNSWGENFEPAKTSLQDILRNRCGHFFLRAYNKDSDMIDSIEFRYYSGLSKIQVDGQSYNPEKPLPPPRDGYKDTLLELISKNGQVLQEKRIDASTDDYRFSKSGKPNIVIELPRIRWKLGLPDGNSNVWLDKPIKMTREEFCDHSQLESQVLIKAPSYIKKVRMGFNGDLNQAVPIKEGITLLSFVDHNEISSPQCNPSYLQFMWEDITVTVITIQADKATCHLGPKLRPAVISGRGRGFWRKGKGFSKGELRDANLHMTTKMPNIYIDHRRKTVYQQNIEVLKGYIDAQGE